MPKIWISRQKRLKLQTGVADPIFELYPWNLVRIDIGLSCKSAEIFIRISQIVLDLAKISVSIQSISWGVLGLLQTLLSLKPYSEALTDWPELSLAWTFHAKSLTRTSTDFLKVCIILLLTWLPTTWTRPSQAWPRKKVTLRVRSLHTCNKGSVG